MFAQPTDVQNRYMGTVSSDNLARLPSLLADASAVVAAYCRQTFTTATTTERIRPIGDRVRLRQSPVATVDSVALVDMLQASQLIMFPLGAWLWDGGQEIWLGGLNTVINLPDQVTHLLQYQTPLMEVTYTHGYADIPEPVVAVVCSMVLRFIDIPASVGMPSTTVGALSYRLSSTAEDGILGLTASEQRTLAPYRRAATTVELR